MIITEVKCKVVVGWAMNDARDTCSWTPWTTIE